MPNTTPRRRLVGVSTKMYFSLSQTQTYIQSCIPLGQTAQSLSVDIFLVPDFLSIPMASQVLQNTTVQLGAQDCHWEDSGAFTGEVSPRVLKELGVSIVELGHAERRRLFGETDADVAKKAMAAERNGVVPLVCIGEKTQGKIEDAVSECRIQILPVLEATKGQLVFAYEPVWAIGADEPASAEYVVAVSKELRKLCEGKGRGADVRFLYGGSAGPGIFEKMKEGVDGLFLGRFAHDVRNFEKVIEEVGGA